MPYLGLDLGTSALKAVLVEPGPPERVLAAAAVPLAVDRPAPGRSEQDPEAWWAAALAAIDRLAAEAPAALAATRGIGLAGQMHGAVLLGADHVPLRPAILWDDGRAGAECRELEAAFPRSRAVAGNRAMPGFTAPKLLWVRRHEPDLFARTALVLLPKAYLRLRLAGEALEDMSDASGTLWLDVGARDWSDAALAATGLDRSRVPRLVEGTAPAGRLRPELARRWGMAAPPVLAGGAGDNAASAVGLGALEPGSAFVSLGTSGVVWATTGGFRPDAGAAAAGLHAFCHAVPDRWHRMAVILSAASALAWLAGVLGAPESQLLAPLGEGPPRAPSPCLFLPYLAGERTPHDDPDARGAFLGLDRATARADLVQAVLEGVAFALRDGLDALAAAGTPVAAADAVGGGARSRAWVALLASALDVPLARLEGGGADAAALGAARLARVAAGDASLAEACPPPRRLEVLAPDPALAAAYAGRLARFRAAYPAAARAAGPGPALS